MKELLLCFLFIIMGLLVVYDPNNNQKVNSVSLNKKQEYQITYDRDKSKLMMYLMLDKGMSFRESIWWSSNISESSKHAGVNTKLLASVIETESKFDVTAVSSKGAVGATQVMPHWSYLGNIKNPSENIKIGAIVLSKYIDLCNGDIKCGLMSYNIGDGNYRNGIYLISGREYYSKIVKNRIMLL